MIKHINSTDRKFQDVMTDNLVLDSQATEGSFNAITSDAVYRAVQEGGGGGGGGSSEIPEHKKGDRGKYLRVSEDDYDTLEWSDVEANVTEGDGIKVEGSTVSVKAGTGLSIGDYRKTEQVTDYVNVPTIGPSGQLEDAIPYICDCGEWWSPIEQGSGISFTLGASWFKASLDLNDPDFTTFYAVPAIVLKSEACSTSFVQPYTQIMVLSTSPIVSAQSMGLFGAQGILGEYDGTFTQFNISFDDVNTSLSNLTKEDLEYDGMYEDYCVTFVLCNSDATALVTGDRLLGWGNGGGRETTGSANYTTTRYVRNGVVVTNPVPTYADSDAGKVLSVNGSGTGLEWGVAGGGASNVEVIDLPDTDASDETLYDILSQLNTAMMVTGKVVFGRIHFYDADDDSGKDYYIPMTKHVNHGAETYYFTVFTTANDAESSATSPMTIYYYECQIGRDMDGENPYIAYYTGYIHPSDINTWTPYPSNE